MSIKISEKDKSLLLVLAIIIVLFAAVMMPKFGIKALYEETKTVKAETAALVTQNEYKLSDLMLSGVPARYAEDYQRAKDAMEDNILHKKHEAIKISNIICNFSNSVFVPYEWTTDIHYLNYQISDLTQYASVLYDQQSENNEDGEIIFPSNSEEVEDERVAVTLSSMRIQIIPDGMNEFGIETEWQIDGVDISSFATLLVYLAQLEQKGSIMLDDYTYNTEGDATVNLTVYMPPEGDMKNYSALIGECDNCGEPYYYEDAANGDYDCPECGEPILPQ